MLLCHCHCVLNLKQKPTKLECSWLWGVHHPVPNSQANVPGRSGSPEWERWDLETWEPFFFGGGQIWQRKRIKFSHHFFCEGGWGRGVAFLFWNISSVLVRHGLFVIPGIFGLFFVWMNLDKFGMTEKEDSKECRCIICFQFPRLVGFVLIWSWQSDGSAHDFVSPKD